MPSASTQINDTPTSIAAEQLPKRGIVIAPDDHTKQDMLSFLPLIFRASEESVSKYARVFVTHLSFIAVDRKDVATTMGMEKSRWRTELLKVVREVILLKGVEYHWGVVVVRSFPPIH